MKFERLAFPARWSVSLLTCCLIALLHTAHAQETVSFASSSAGNTLSGSERVDAIFTKVNLASPAGKLPAVILLHSGWGWSDEHEGFTDYAKVLQKGGFATLELHMFPTSGSGKGGGPAAYLPELFGALNYLSGRPDVDPARIGVTGFSFGGLLALVSATSWANKTYAVGGQTFKAFAPFYPICWVVKANIEGRKSPVPAEAWLEWSGAPVKIFAGGNDDYDDRDPNACHDAVQALPETQRRFFSIQMYPNATHGWDQRKSANFYEKLACKGRGCINSNQPNSEITQISIKDLIDFMSANLKR